MRAFTLNAHGTDGRSQRTAKTRARILSTTRELILAGHPEPTAKQIADTCDITTRTLFRHFVDMEGLYQSFISEMLEQAARVMDEPFPEALDWQEAIAAVINRRARVYESLLPVYLSTIWRRYEISETKGVSRRRKRLREILPTRLSEDRLAFEAIDACLGIEYWVSLRRDQRLGVNKATEVLTHAVNKLIS